MPQGQDYELLTVNAIAREVQMDHKRVARIMESVEPFERIGKSKKYRWRQFVDAYARELKGGDDVLDYTQERARLAAAQANKQELEGKILSGELVRASDVVDDVGTCVTNAKARLLGIPSKAAAIGEGMTRAELEDTLTDMVNEALNELAATSFRTVESASEATG